MAKIANGGNKNKNRLWKISFCWVVVVTDRITNTGTNTDLQVAMQMTLSVGLGVRTEHQMFLKPVTLILTPLILQL